jgi:hypothetical protein
MLEEEEEVSGGLVVVAKDVVEEVAVDEAEAAETKAKLQIGFQSPNWGVWSRNVRSND